MAEIERIGIVGGGQLGRMLTEAATAESLGFKTQVVDKTDNCPAAQVGAEQIQAELGDELAIGRLVAGCHVTTWEIEHFPAEYLVAWQAAGACIEPDPTTLAVIQDKLTQKQHLAAAGIPVEPFSPTLNEDDFIGGGPYMVKTRRGGYDGRGNLKVDRLDDPAIQQTFQDTAVYAEQIVGFDKELSVIAARDKQGNAALYPVVETIHKNSICHTVMSPAEISPRLSSAAQELARDTLKQLGGAGVFAIEMFAVGDDVMVNEIAPRVHNSGHLTIEANQTSQFTQHIRAIAGLPLGSTGQISPVAVMVNILGRREQPFTRAGLADALSAGPDVHVHFYGKDPRPGRKIGHVTVLGASMDETLTIAQQARDALAV